MIKWKQSYSAIFPDSRANNSGCSGSISPIIKLIQDLMGIYIVAKFGIDWSILADWNRLKCRFSLIFTHIATSIYTKSKIYDTTNSADGQISCWFPCIHISTLTLRTNLALELLKFRMILISFMLRFYGVKKSVKIHC